MAGARDRPRGGRASEPGADAAAPPPQSHRVSERDPRSAGPRRRRRRRLVPADDQSYGFDNVAGVLKVSPTLLERYMNAARSDQPPGRRRVAAGAGRRDVPHRLRSLPVPAPRRAAVRDARRHDGAVQLPAGRRVRDRAGTARPLRRRPDPRTAPARAERGRGAGSRSSGPDGRRTPADDQGDGLQPRSRFKLRDPRPQVKAGPRTS